MSEVLGRPREVSLGSVEQIPIGEGRAFEVGALAVAVFRTRTNEVYASQAKCPHRAGPLADGMLGGNVITCPLHERTYDLASGKELSGECGLTMYSVRKADDGTLILTIPEA